MSKTGGPKLPQPRQLRQNETVQSLNQWKNVFRNYYRRCPYMGTFLVPTTTWDPQEECYGFEDERGNDGRKKEEIYADLEGFFETIGGFCPHDYMSQKLLTSTKNIQDVWNILYEAFDAEVNPGSFLDYISLKKETGETYRNFWNRLVGYVEQHLAKNPTGGTPVEIEGIAIPTGGDKISVTMLDLITMYWMSQIDPRLSNIVKVEFATELKSERICQLVKRIATNADELLKRFENPKDQIQTIATAATAASSIAGAEATSEQSCTHDPDIIRRLERVERKYNKSRKGRRSGYGDRDRDRGGDRSDKYEKSGQFCNHCDYINRKLGANLDTNHRKDRCAKKEISIKLIQEHWNEDASSSSTDSDGEDPEALSDLYYLLSLQNDPAWSCPPSVVKAKIKTAVRILKPKKKTVLLSKETHQVQISDPGVNKTPVEQEIPTSLLRLVQSSSYDWKNILRSDSPRMKCRRAGIDSAALLDSGAMINVLDEKFARKSGIQVERTDEVAEAANHLPLDIVGQSVEPVTIEAITKEGSVTIHLGIVLIIKNLGVDILIGEPGKKTNNIVCWPRQEMILFADHMHTASYFKAKKLYMLARVSTPTELEPGEAWTLQLPSNMAHLERVLISPRVCAQDWIQPAVIDVTDGSVSIRNSSDRIVKLGKTDHLVDVRDTVEFEIPHQVRFVINNSREDTFQYQHFGHHNDPPEKYLDQCKIDPDNVLTEEQRQTFREINLRYARTITPRPGRYNGYYGHIDNRIHFSQKPAPNVKTHIPNYSPAMNKILGEKMDILEEWGVLMSPEELGITVEHVQPSMLVPKKEPGEYRCVTDFSSINKSIKRVPNTSATMAQARARIAKAEYVVHLDFSNYFYQNGMQKEDVMYLGTIHPFKGVRVYTCDPQGCKGASERSYEKLVRVYGDMVQDDRLAQMADGLHVLGQTVEEVTLNYIEVLNRAENAGFTFKPSQVIICPRNITLFGWDLRGSVWMPTAHTTSALVKASKPTTVKQMRGFIGSFKQISSCIPGYANALHNLDKVVGGRGSSERIQWTEELGNSFDEARRMAGDPRGIVEPRPTDQLHTYSDWSEQHRAVGGRLTIHRTNKDGKIEILNGGFYSSILSRHKKAWLPCEGEAAGIRFVLEHFQHQIRESHNVTIHHTDSQPCVMAWKRAQRGAFSSSARIAAFLTGLSSLPIELQYTPGRLMHTSDYASRHPIECKNPKKCQICQFTGQWEEIGDNAQAIRSVSVEDIKAGKSVMPMIQSKVWINIQSNDSTITKLLNLIETGQLPETKKTKGDYTKLKLLHGQYRAGKLVINKDGLVLIKTPEGNFNGAAILVPHKLFLGVMSAIHIRLDHPSKAQLTNLVARYFYTPGWRAMIEEVSDNCHLCAAAKSLPAVLLSDTNTINKGFGSEFAADVVEREGQKILVVKEKLSQYVRASLISDQTADTLRQEVIALTSEFVPDSGATVRVDGATAFQSLERESITNGTLLNRLKIRIEVGRLLNKNKNASVEIANKEIEKEILRLKEKRGKISSTDLTLVIKNINNRVRYHGLSSREIVFRRQLIDNSEKNVIDEEIAKKQLDNKIKESKYSEKFKSKSRKRSGKTKFNVGDLVFLKAGRDKNNLRETYSVEQTEDDGTILIRKYQASLRAKLYRARPEEIVRTPMSAATNQQTAEESEGSSQKEVQHPHQSNNMEDQLTTNPDNDDDRPPGHSRPRRKAFQEARNKLGYKVRSIDTFNSRRKAMFGWDEDDQDSSDDEFYHYEPPAIRPRLDESSQSETDGDEDDNNNSDLNDNDIGSLDSTFVEAQEEEEEEFSSFADVASSSRATSTNTADPSDSDRGTAPPSPAPGYVVIDQLDISDIPFHPDWAQILPDTPPAIQAEAQIKSARPGSDVLTQQELSQRFPDLFQRSLNQTIREVPPQSSSGLITPASPNSVPLDSVSNLGPALHQALQAIDPRDTVQLGAAAPIVNLDRVEARLRRRTPQPGNYKDFHKTGSK